MATHYAAASLYQIQICRMTQDWIRSELAAASCGKPKVGIRYLAATIHGENALSIRDENVADQQLKILKFCF